MINVTSVAADGHLPGASVYSATKGALETASKVLAQELGPRNIRVNTIAPGLVETEGARSVGIMESDFPAQVKAKTPLGRIGQPDDIARIAVFLASDDAHWVTGERITAAGGMV